MALLARKLAKKICEIQAHTGNTTCLDLGETGRVLVTGGQDKLVNLWAFGSDKCFLSLQGHNGSIMCAKFACNDNIVYSADENGVIKRWILEQEDECNTFYGHLKSVRTIDCHPFGVSTFFFMTNFVVFFCVVYIIRCKDKDNQWVIFYRKIFLS